MADGALAQGELGGRRPERRRWLGDMRPHGKVALVTGVLAATGIAVLAVSLPWLDRTGDRVETVRTVYQPPLDALQDIDQGLSETQFLFDATITELDSTQRVLNLESVRRTLSQNEEAWRRFEDSAVDLPGEAELVRRYEDAMARQTELAGPVGLGLVVAEDPTTLVNSDIVRDLLAAQREAQVAVQELQGDVYEPARDAELAAADADADQGRTVVLGSFLVLMALSLVVAALAFRSARRTDRVQRVDAERRAVEARRNAFENRLVRALDMASSEPFAFDVLAQATGEVLPGARAELLLAEDRTAPFRRVLVVGADSRGPGCRVTGPIDCPAAHRGDRLAFGSSTDLDACPYLRERPGERAAVCQPVSIAGRNLGVVHATLDDGLPSDEAQVDLELLARRAGDRIAMLRAFAESESQARTDPLTGLLNRRSLDVAVRELEERGGGYCVAYADLDHFKRLNDTWGHEVGDRALHLFARILAEAVRPDDLVCRYGGEEFVLVLPDCELGEAEAAVQRVRETMAPALHEAGLPPFTVSVGLAASNQAPSFSGVVALADAALLRAKADGRDRVVVVGSGPAALPPAP